MSQLEILYEDGPLLVVNKSAGLLTQAPRGIDSLEIHVAEHYRQRDGKAAEDKIYVGLVHRLDRPVSGAIAFTRHVRAARKLAKQFQDRTVSKTYWACVAGNVAEDEGTWTDYLHKRHGMAQAEVVTEDHPAAKHAVLHYRARHRADGWTWLEIELETGRTHQIRIQAASRGHAVIGDSQYGSEVAFGPPELDLRDRPIALHARELGFLHPMTEETMQLTAPLSESWRQFEHTEFEQTIVSSHQ